jgi:chromosome segregation ATPase
MELQCSATAFFDAGSDLENIFTSPEARRKQRQEENKKYEAQIRSLELDAVTLMDELDALNTFKLEAGKIDAALREERERLKDEAKNLRVEVREMKENVSIYFTIFFDISDN